VYILGRPSSRVKEAIHFCLWGCKGWTQSYFSW